MWYSTFMSHTDVYRCIQNNSNTLRPMKGNSWFKYIYVYYKSHFWHTKYKPILLLVLVQNYLPCMFQYRCFIPINKIKISLSRNKILIILLSEFLLLNGCLKNFKIYFVTK